MKVHNYELIDEKVFEHELDNGLKLFIIPKPGFQKTFVTYTTQFGSLDNNFLKKKKKIYLQHLLKKMHRQLLSLALIVQVTYLVLQITSKVILSVY